MAARKRGWCPSLYEPMPSGDGLLVRVKPSGLKLSSEQLLVIGQCAQQFGSGHINLTQRGNLQLRGLTLQSAQQCLEQMLRHNLVSPDACQERRRNILVSGLAGFDPGCHPRTSFIAAALEDAVVAEPALGSLSGKFGFVVDGGGLWPLGAAHADIALRFRAGSWFVEAGGPQPLAARADDEGQLIHAALAMARLCARAQQRPVHMPSAAMLLELFDATGLRAAPVIAASRPAPEAKPPAPGVLHSPQMVHLGVPLGQMQARTLIQLAESASRQADGFVRFSPWRTVALCHYRADARLERKLKGLIISPDDPRLRVITCPGRDGCAAGAAPTVRDAALMASFAPAGGIVHLSGCAKGCAHPRAAMVAVTASEHGYELATHARAGAEPLYSGLSTRQVCDLLAAMFPPCAKE